MNILVAGRLGQYADRIVALKHLGHGIVYSTMPLRREPLRPLLDDLKDETVPRFAVERGTAHEVVTRLVGDYAIEVIYSTKNVWDGSLEFLEELLDCDVEVPIVRHHKEHFCSPNELERRSLTETAAQVYINRESLDYFRRTYNVPLETAHILETDLLPAKYMTAALRPKLFDLDGRPHLLIAGSASADGGRTDVRELCLEMSRRRVHVHLYGRKFTGPTASGAWRAGHQPTRKEYERLSRLGYVHLHDQVEPAEFSERWSEYDAGLMHVSSPRTSGPFQSMNYPNRIGPYLAAGLPLAQAVGQTAMERLVTDQGIGFVYHSYEELAQILYDRAWLRRLTAMVLAKRHTYTFEHQAPKLVEILSAAASP